MPSLEVEANIMFSVINQSVAGGFFSHDGMLYNTHFCVGSLTIFLISMLMKSSPFRSLVCTGVRVC